MGQLKTYSETITLIQMWIDKIFFKTGKSNLFIEFIFDNLMWKIM